jgi:phenylalanyl-tRNA synthetase beta chain
MPVITMNRGYLNRLLGREIGEEELEKVAASLGAEVDEFMGADVLIEMPPNRSDMYSIEGFARASKGIMGIEKGIPRYEPGQSGTVLTVDESVNDVRPFVVGGLAGGFELDDDVVVSLMDFQEKIHLTVGRNRKKVSIGIHDFDKVEPPFTYLAVEPKSRRFVPLAKEEEMDMAEILQKHEKGMDFAFLLDGFNRYPLIVDKNDNVLSFPPIINSRLTTVTEETKNIFIDVTGTDLGLCTNALNLMATAMIEMGASLETIETKYPDKTMVTPDLSSKKKKLNASYANRLLGLDIEPERIRESFERMRFGAELKDDEIEVEIPAYRSDILHPADLVEDLAIGYGYDNFEFTMPRVLTFGTMMELTQFCGKMRDVLIGLGFQEVNTLIMTKGSDLTKIMNPLSEEYDSLRASIIPSLLEVLRTNKRHDLPQMVFQIGDVVEGSRPRKKLGAAIIHSKASFTEAKSYAESILGPLKHDVKGTKHPYFINGR